MKKIVVVVCMFFTLQSIAQTKPAQWVTIKSANLKCWECKEKLEKHIAVENKATYESGIIQWRVYLLQGEIKLQYWPDRISPDDIRVMMNNAGFDADNEKATEEVYKKLPPICKRPEDGGGQKKGAPPCHVQPM